MILARLLANAIRERGVSERECARQIGISPSTVGRILRGESVDIDILIKVADWLGVAPSLILDSFLPKDNLGETVAAILQANLELAKVFGEAVEKLDKGEIDIGVMRDLIAYMTWRLNLISGDSDESSRSAG